MKPYIFPEFKNENNEKKLNEISYFLIIDRYREICGDMNIGEKDCWVLFFAKNWGFGKFYFVAKKFGCEGKKVWEISDLFFDKILNEHSFGRLIII